jgi:hypothetical protein
MPLLWLLLIADCRAEWLFSRPYFPRQLVVWPPLPHAQNHSNMPSHLCFVLEYVLAAVVIVVVATFRGEGWPVGIRLAQGLTYFLDHHLTWITFSCNPVLLQIVL